jgi:uncharacterized hydrophobic protein (TIGR00271 family)
MTRLDTHRWLTPSLLRGIVFALGGITVLLMPHASLKVLRYVGGSALLLSGASGLRGLRQSQDRLQTALRAVLAIGTGAGLLAIPVRTIQVAELVAAAYLAAAGLLAIHRAVRLRRQGSPAPIHFARSALFLALAALLLVLPRAMFELAVAAVAIMAVIVGLAMFSWSLRHGSEKPLVADRGLASEVFWEWLADRDMGPERRRVVAAGLYFEDPDRLSKGTSYLVMLLLSVALASLAILQDSTAVIIGAMLVAPLMTPIMGCAAGLVTGWRSRVLSSLVVIAVSVVLSIALAWVLAAWIPALVPLEANSQVLSRASPTLVDLAIALAAGAAGAYATVDERVSSSLTGVAIAVALVPPLGVVGVTLEAGHWVQALGALLLFTTNLVSILVAASVVFVLVGLPPVKKEGPRRVKNADVIVSVLVVALLIMVPLGLTGRRVLTDSERLDTATSLVDEWLEASPTLRLLRVEARAGAVDVEVAGSGEVPSIKALEESLSQRMGRPVTVRVELFASVILDTSDQELRE